MYGVIVTKYGYPEYESVPGSTFEELLEYVKKNENGNITRVVIPRTGYGYASSLIERANSEWLENHYPRAIKNVCFNVTISRWKFLHASGEELRELIQKLAEDHPLIDDEIHSRLETEAKEEAWHGWAASEIDSDLSPEELRDVLEYFSTGIWEILEIDTDGITVYLPKREIEAWQATISELSANQ